MEIRRHLTAANAWKATGIAVTAFEAFAPRGELMSNGVDRGIEKHPLLTRACIGITALHLMNLLPEKIDPFVYTEQARKLLFGNRE